MSRALDRETSRGPDNFDHFVILITDFMGLSGSIWGSSLLGQFIRQLDFHEEQKCGEILIHILHQCNSIGHTL